MTSIKQQFPGLTIDGIYEPSQALLDECTHQFDSRTLRYVEPAKCNSRELEISVGKSDKKLRIESSTLAIRETKHTSDEDVSTAYKLLNCLKRRAIAYEFAGLISYGAHERYTDKLLRRLNSEPPPNYQQTSIMQILKADREVWVYMTQTVQDIRPSADGTRPLDKALHDALSDYNVTFHMLPLPMASSNAYAPLRSREDHSNREQNFVQFWLQRTRFQQKRKGQSQGHSPGLKLCAKRYQRRSGKRCKGQAYLLQLQLVRVQEAAAGASCKKGKHVCFKANSLKPHACSSAHAEEMPKQTA